MPDEDTTRSTPIEGQTTSTHPFGETSHGHYLFGFAPWVFRTKAETRVCPDCGWVSRYCITYDMVTLLCRAPNERGRRRRDQDTGELCFYHICDRTCRRYRKVCIFSEGSLGCGVDGHEGAASYSTVLLTFSLTTMPNSISIDSPTKALTRF